MYRLAFDDREVSVDRRSVEAFRDFHLGRFSWRARVSDLCIAKMIAYQQVFGLDPIEIIETFKALEGAATRMTKRPTRFRKLPLRGLWHCHFFAARFMASNMLAALEGDVLMRIAMDEYADLLESGQQPSEERIEKFAARVMEETLDKRAKESRLTGEWIVYLPRGGENYYLTITTHDAGDAATFEEIVRLCTINFPDIIAWIAEARAEVS